MGEYADMEIEREIRQTGARIQREYEDSIRGLTRKQLGQRIAAEQQAIHEARQVAISLAQSVIDEHAEALASRGLTIVREGRGFTCIKGPSCSAKVIGKWQPDRTRGTVNSRKVKLAGTEGWLVACFKAAKPAQDAGQTTRVEAPKP